MNKKIVSAFAIAVLAMGLTACGDKEAASAPEPKTAAAPAEEIETVVEEPEEVLTPAQENAVKKAELYLDMTAFSRDGLVDQLVFDKFDEADASFAVDYIDVDWNEQAVKQGQTYIDLTPMSHDGLVDQLVYDKFTTDEATHAANTLGL